MATYVMGFESWDAFIEWYSSLPIVGQLFVIIGVFALIALIITGVYYLLKGVAYLVYYILKGVYYLIRALIYAHYKFFEELYYLISGKERPIKESKAIEQQTENIPKENVIQTINNKEFYPKVKYCSECGSEISEGVIQQLATKGVAFCPHCGKGFKSNFIEIEG